jgi:quercetin dioxygenase-like cupin family protein
MRGGDINPVGGIRGMLLIHRGLPDRASLSSGATFMTDKTLTGSVAKSGMHDLADVASLVEIQAKATVSRTVLQAEGARVVLFSFDAGQILTEHTAAVPALLQVLDGHLRITADGRTVDLRPGGLVHLAARLPHAVEAVEASRLQLTMLDSRVPA